MQGSPEFIIVAQWQQWHPFIQGWVLSRAARGVVALVTSSLSSSSIHGVCVSIVKLAKLNFRAGGGALECNVQ